MQLVFPQDATYWGTPVTNGYGGQTFGAPAAIKVRWEDKNEEFVDEAGNRRLSQAVVYSEVDMETGGWLLLGTSAGSDPTVVDGALPIQKYSKTPDLRASRFLRKAWL